MSEWLFPLQKLINDALKYDLGAQTKLQALAGKTFVLKVTEPKMALSLNIESDGFVFVQPGEVTPCDALVSGKAKDLFAVLRAEDRTAAMMAHEINISGDTRTFFALQEVMAHLDIDWEMALGDKIGDLAAHVVADGIRFFGEITKNQFKSFQRTSRNFLREESGWLVPDSLWRAHRQQIQAVRQDVDRLGARLRKLQIQIEARKAADQ
ncbi:MAG: SCP2 sterol-binding domain-containing protein [Reinekea sp.]|jgi:ubiquinone biosynthesis accessory factor UbiJ